MDLKNPTETAVAQIWAQVLELDYIGPDDHFIGLGGDSMLMMMALFQVRERFGIELEPTAIIESPTLREFSKRIDDSLAQKP